MSIKHVHKLFASTAFFFINFYINFNRNTNEKTNVTIFYVNFFC